MQRSCDSFRELFKHPQSEEDLNLIRKAAHYCQPVGDDRFSQQIKQQYGIRLGKMERGRPRKGNLELFNI